MSRKLSAKEFDSLFYSALARQHADFLVGINFTRAVTLLFSSKTNGQKDGVWSVGRVQTPTLRLVVERDEIIEKFRKVKYYVVKGVFKHLSSGFVYTGVLKKEDFVKKKDLNQIPGFTEKEAYEILEKLKREKVGVVQSIEKVKRSESPPELFSLSTLQKVAGSLYKLSAERVHEIAQRLYQDYKVISYPRTEATGLPENMVPFVKKLLIDLGHSDIAQKVSSSYTHVFNKAKLTDHHAIIPLKSNPSLPEGSLEKKIFDLIKTRFIASFMDPYQYIVIVVKTSLGEYVFTSRFRKVVDLGWRRVFFEDLDGEDEKEKLKEEVEVKEFPLNRYDVVEKDKVYVEERETKPPSRFTDGSLIYEMKKLGLGTPATRDNIIETLIKRGYIERRKNSLISTKKGRELISFLREEEISSPEMTAKWEEFLERIYVEKHGKTGYVEFIKKIKTFIKKELEFFVSNRQNSRTVSK